LSKKDALKEEKYLNLVVRPRTNSHYVSNTA